MIDLVSIGRRISGLRKDKGVSQEELAQVLGIQRSSISRIESGKRDVTYREMQLLSSFFGIELDEFVPEDTYEEELALYRSSNLGSEIPEQEMKQVNVLLDRLLGFSSLYSRFHPEGGDNPDD